MRIVVTYQVAFWTGSYNKLSDKVFTSAQDAKAYLGDNRNGVIYRNVNKVED
jgi:hypothetical protein